MTTLTHEIERDKTQGTVLVTIHNAGITTQRADKLAQGMFVCPVKLVTRVLDAELHLREYRAIGWNGPAE